MKKYILPTLLSVGLLNASPTNLPSNFIQQVVAKINSTLPKTSTDGTVVKELKFTNNRMTYVYQFPNYDKKSGIFESKYGLIKQQTQESVCHSSQVGNLINLGITLEYIYHDKDMNQLGYVEVNETICKNLKK